jgi:hypothetical protein
MGHDHVASPTVLPSGVRDASSLTEPGDLNVSLCEPEASAAFFARAGIAVFDGVLAVPFIDECRKVFQKTSARVEEALSARGVGHEGSYFGYEVAFNEVCQRGRERLDIRTGMADEAFGDPRLHSEAPWMGFVEAVLGSGAQECFRGVLDNRPGSTAQSWHADWKDFVPSGGEPEEARHMTLFIPLVDLHDPACGATQYFPGSHLKVTDTRQAVCCTPRPGRGSVIAFDYRVIHRGCPNLRPPGIDMNRPMMHIVYARRGHADILEREAASNNPLFGVPPTAGAARLRVHVRTGADLRLRITKGPEGRVVILPEQKNGGGGASGSGDGGGGGGGGGGGDGGGGGGGSSSEVDSDDEDSDEPYTVAERSVHEVSMPLQQWLQQAAAHLRYDVARNERFPQEARRDAKKRAATLEGLAALRRCFVMSVQDPTGESSIHD